MSIDKSFHKTRTSYKYETELIDIIIEYSSNEHGWISEILMGINFKDSGNRPKYYRDNGYSRSGLEDMFGRSKKETEAVYDVCMQFDTLKQARAFIEAFALLTEHIIDADPREKSKRLFSELFATLNK